MIKRKATVYVMIALLFMLTLYPMHQAYAARATGTVKNRILNVRSDASTSSSIVCKLSQGTKVTILSETTGKDGMKWYNVYFAYNGGTAEGYVRADLLNVSGTVSGSTTAAPTDNSSSGETLYVNRAAVRVRKSSTTGSDIVATLRKGDEVKAQGTTTGADGSKWTSVSFSKDGQKQGYIRSDLLISAKPSDSGTAGTGDSGTLYVSASSVHVRQSADATSATVAGLAKGAEVRKTSSETGRDGKQWTKVSFTKDGKKTEGYIRSDLLTSTAPAGTTSQAAGSEEEEYRYVNASALRVRDHASTSSDVIANLLKGDKVKVKSTQTGSDGKEWVQVSFTIYNTKYHGYIRSDYLSKTKPSDDSAGSGTQISSGTSDSTKTGTPRLAVVNVRQTASTSSSIVAKITQETKVSILSETTGSDGKKWYQISCTHKGTAVKGYIRADLLNF